MKPLASFGLTTLSALSETHESAIGMIADWGSEIAKEKLMKSV